MPEEENYAVVCRDTRKIAEAFIHWFPLPLFPGSSSPSSTDDKSVQLRSHLAIAYGIVHTALLYLPGNCDSRTPLPPSPSSHQARPRPLPPKTTRRRRTRRSRRKTATNGEDLNHPSQMAAATARRGQATAARRPWNPLPTARATRVLRVLPGELCTSPHVLHRNLILRI